MLDIVYCTHCLSMQILLPSLINPPTITLGACEHILYTKVPSIILYVIK